MMKKVDLLVGGVLNWPIYTGLLPSSPGPAVWYAGQLEPQVGSFSKYLYFQYIPTILYRDNYPRSEMPWAILMSI